MPIYLVQSAVSGCVKIGFAENVARRWMEIQVGNHEHLDLVAVLDGSKEDEAVLHRKLTALHKRGEWFDRAVVDLVDQWGLARIGMSTTRRRMGRPLAQREDAGLAAAIQAAGSATALATMLRIRPQAVALWVRVPENRVATIAEAYGIKPAALRPDLFDATGARRPATAA